MVSARPPNLPTSTYTQRTSSSSLFLEISTTSVSMTPALPTTPRPGSLMGSGSSLPRSFHRAQPNDERAGRRNVTLLRARVRVGNTLRGGARGPGHLDFGYAGAGAPRAQRGQRRPHFRRRVCLSRIEPAAVGQRLREGLIVV